MNTINLNIYEAQNIAIFCAYFAMIGSFYSNLVIIYLFKGNYQKATISLVVSAFTGSMINFIIINIFFIKRDLPITLYSCFFLMVISVFNNFFVYYSHILKSMEYSFDSEDYNKDERNFQLAFSVISFLTIFILLKIGISFVLILPIDIPERIFFIVLYFLPGVLAIFLIHLSLKKFKKHH